MKIIKTDRMTLSIDEKSGAIISIRGSVKDFV